jgi:hypothetical protein
MRLAAERETRQAAFALLESARRIPGTQGDGTIDTGRLIAWITETRELCEKFGRKDIGDQGPYCQYLVAIVHIS